MLDGPDKIYSILRAKEPDETLLKLLKERCIYVLKLDVWLASGHWNPVVAATLPAIMFIGELLGPDLTGKSPKEVHTLVYAAVKMCLADSCNKEIDKTPA